VTRVAKRYKRRAARSNRCQECSDLVTPDNAGGIVDFSGTTGPNNDSKITAGSIEGAGNYYLGSNQLAVGRNNISTKVSGVISDCGPNVSGLICANPSATGDACILIFGHQRTEAACDESGEAI
jgi:hypothetical protein